MKPCQAPSLPANRAEYPAEETRQVKDERIFWQMARPKGFEPLTPRFVVWCSIQLSYGRALQASVVCEAFS